MQRCSYKEIYDKCCSCKKTGLKCSILCNECLGVFCANAMVQSDIDNEMDLDDVPDRHFLDMFNE